MRIISISDEPPFTSLTDWLSHSLYIQDFHFWILQYDTAASIGQAENASDAYLGSMPGTRLAGLKAICSISAK